MPHGCTIRKLFPWLLHAAMHEKVEHVMNWTSGPQGGSSPRANMACAGFFFFLNRMARAHKHGAWTRTHLGRGAELERHQQQLAGCQQRDAQGAGMG
jgi:hypothetical protein